MTYDTTGKRIRTENLAGQATTTAWDCCHKVSETRPDGSVTTWDYDDEDRLVASSRLIPLDLTNVTWVATCYAYGNRGELLEVNNASPTGTISKYIYTYDAAGRRVGCDKSGSAFTTPDTNSYLYNARSELTNATAAVDSAYRYSYDFDDIGNRETSSECGTNSVYTANNLNQYTAVDDFTPQFDDDGNQTLVKTATGVWSVIYNGENRPILWTCTQSNNSNNTNNQTISMSFDRMGRRVTKNAQRFVYDGYLQIANFEHSTSNVELQAFIWDPTEPVATRPLVWNRDTSSAYYTHDGNKNVSEVVATGDAVSAHYEYAPFGAVLVMHGGEEQSNPWRFSSEYSEDDSATVYYNYRHYEPVMGRWLSRDMIEEDGGVCLYVLCNNGPTIGVDVRGAISAGEVLGMVVSDLKCRLQASGSLSYTMRPVRFPLLVSPPVWIEMDITVYAEISTCCDDGEVSAKIRFGAAVDAYAAVGMSWKRQEPSHNELKKKGLTRNSKAIDPGTGLEEKYKKHHSEASSGFRDKWGSIGVAGNTTMPECPKKLTGGVDWSVFVRGSAGLVVGYQFNIVKRITSFDEVFTLNNITATGYKAWGVTGWSFEVGVTGDFYGEEKFKDFLAR